MIEGELSSIWVRGEISNFKPHSSGHFYFSLKDSKSQISAVMFRGFNSRLKFKPHDGLEVIIKGKVTVYEPRGQYQIACEMMEPVGAGALQKQFEQLKAKLKSEGLFELNRKKQLPFFPHHIAVVTSPTGAAIQDILNIIRRRAPSLEVTVVPTVVQGAQAAGQICEAFKNAEKLKPDVIIVGRGGGSIEDMWCFNDEALARLIAQSQIPTISAVGHEIDFTICDFVSDLRAPTPSAAAELVSKSSMELLQKVQLYDRSLKNSILKTFQILKQKMIFLNRQLVDPKKKLQDLILRNDELSTRLEQSVQTYFQHLKKDITLLSQRLVTPQQAIVFKRNQLSGLKLNLDFKIKQKVQNYQSQLDRLKAVAHSLSPLQVVDRGYSVSKIKNKVIKSIQQIKNNDVIDIQVGDGEIHAQVISINETKGSSHGL